MGSRHVVYNPSQVEADVEDISMLLDPLLKEVWGERMFRIKLKVKDSETRGHLRYRIESPPYQCLLFWMYFRRRSLWMTK